MFQRERGRVLSCAFQREREREREREKRERVPSFVFLKHSGSSPLQVFLEMKIGKTFEKYLVRVQFSVKLHGKNLQLY